MQSPSNTEIVNALVQAIARKDFAAAEQYISSDCEYTNVPLGTVQGPAGVRAVLEGFFAPTTENEFVIKAVVQDGPFVAVERLDRHHLESGWVELPVFGIWQVTDGKVSAWRDYFDFETLQRQWPVPLR